MKVIATVVAPDQTCGVPRRYIAENVAFLRDVVELANEYNLPVAILSLDQEKAFDRVDWFFLFATLAKWALVTTLSGGSGFFTLTFVVPSLSTVTPLALSRLPVGCVKDVSCPMCCVELALDRLLCTHLGSKGL